MLCSMEELPIIQKAYDLIKWYVPILNRLPRDHHFMLGSRMAQGLYELLEGLIQARYTKEKVAQLQALNTRLEVLRYQSRLLLDFDLVSVKRYEFAGRLLNEIGIELGGWLKQQRQTAA
jgi:23S rRNA-intervening sequence protein